jgi:predicted signal transduction protein with EAL and GGDEF domain
LTVRSVDAGDALLLRVGAVFGWACATAVTLAAVGGAEWEALTPKLSDGEVRVNGARWTVVQSEGDVEL